MARAPEAHGAHPAPLPRPLQHHRCVPAVRLGAPHGWEFRGFRGFKPPVHLVLHACGCACLMWYGRGVRSLGWLLPLAQRPLQHHRRVPGVRLGPPLPFQAQHLGSKPIMLGHSTTVVTAQPHLVIAHAESCDITAMTGAHGCPPTLPFQAQHLGTWSNHTCYCASLQCYVMGGRSLGWQQPEGIANGKCCLVCGHTLVQKHARCQCSSAKGGCMCTEWCTAESYPQ